MKEAKRLEHDRTGRDQEMLENDVTALMNSAPKTLKVTAETLCSKHDPMRAAAALMAACERRDQKDREQLSPILNELNEHESGAPYEPPYPLTTSFDPTNIVMNGFAPLGIVAVPILVGLLGSLSSLSDNAIQAITSIVVQGATPEIAMQVLKQVMATVNATMDDMAFSAVMRIIKFILRDHYDDTVKVLLGLDSHVHASKLMVNAADSQGGSVGKMNARAILALALEEPMDVRAFPLLIDLVKDTRADVRFAAASSLGNYGARRAIPFLRAAQVGAPREAQHICLHSMKRIIGLRMALDTQDLARMQLAEQCILTEAEVIQSARFIVSGIGDATIIFGKYESAFLGNPQFFEDELLTLDAEGNWHRQVSVEGYNHSTRWVAGDINTVQEAVAYLRKIAHTNHPVDMFCQMTGTANGSDLSHNLLQALARQSVPELPSDMLP